MLIRFRTANYRSLRDEQELSMVASLREERNDLLTVEGLDFSLVRVAGIYGANAAGKSNVLNALAFMRVAIVNSHRFWNPSGPIPIDPFLLGSSTGEAVSSFEVDFLRGDTPYNYGFTASAAEIKEEWLFSYPRGKRLTLFKRSSHKPKIIFGKTLKGSNKTIEKLTRKNSLFLSVAAENNHEALSEIYSWFAEKLVFTAPSVKDMVTTARLIEGGLDKKTVVNLMTLADLGITDLEVAEEPLNELARDMLKPIFRDASPETISQTFLNADNPSLPKVQFRHKSEQQAVFFPAERESKGTLAWFFLTGHLLKALATGSVLCVDEMNSSLHPRLALEIINIFQDPTKNINNSQLIFNTHDTSFIGNLAGPPGLQRDQVWFVEKDDQGATHLYPLTDFRPRKQENLERGYLQGRYGAVPLIQSTVVDEEA